MSRFNSRQWLSLAKLGSSFACPEMRLLGNHGEVLAEGRGQLHLDSDGDFHFDMEGQPADVEELLAFVDQQRRDPYNGLRRFRLVAMDADNRELLCGFTLPEIRAGDEISPWKFTGSAEGPMLDAPALGETGTEILLFVPEGHWISWVLGYSFPTANVGGVSQHSVQLLGSTLDFEYEPSTRTLTISVTGSENFPQTLTEGWLSEPLRMMVGQLAFPRIMVRSNPDCAIVMIPPTRHWYDASNGIALLDSAATFDDPLLFFEMYAELLTFVATARDNKVGANFDRHPLTLFYEEIAQSMRGSRWVVTLTLASAVEGLLDLMFPPGARDETVDLDELKNLKRYIDGWKGCPTSSKESIDLLKDRAKGAVSFAAEMTAIKRLRLLREQRKIRADELSAWENVRNKVAHGKIFSPFSSEENDATLLGLMSLFRRLASLIALGRSPPAAMLVSVVNNEKNNDGNPDHPAAEKSAGEQSGSG